MSNPTFPKAEGSIGLAWIWGVFALVFIALPVALLLLSWLFTAIALIVYALSHL